MSEVIEVEVRFIINDADGLPTTVALALVLDEKLEVAKFNPISHCLCTFKQLIATTVYDVETKDGYYTAEHLNRICRTVRLDADKTYKILNAPQLKVQRGLCALVETINLEVEPLDAAWFRPIDHLKEKAV